MKRQDWQTRLWAELEAAESRQFAYGKHDCVTLVARCLDQITDAPQYVRRLRRIYKTRREALSMVGELYARAAAELGSMQPRNLARQGDIVYALLDTGPALGLCTGPRFAIAAIPRGVSYKPLEMALGCWRIE